MLAHIRKKLEQDANVLADRLETTFGPPKKIEMYEEMDGYGIRLRWGRMGFESDKTYLITLTLDDGGL